MTLKRSHGKTINLQHRGGQLESHGSVLQLGKMTPRDSGDYFCIVQNGHPPSSMKTIRVNVMCKYSYYLSESLHIDIFTVGPEVTALHAGAEQKVRLGITARLGCLVKGYPSAVISWFKDGKGLNCFY